jgi:hypothetical protein
LTTIQLKDNCNKIDHCYLSQAQSLRVLGLFGFWKSNDNIFSLKYCSEILEKVLQTVEKYLDLTTWFNSEIVSSQNANFKPKMPAQNLSDFLTSWRAIYDYTNAPRCHFTDFIMVFEYLKIPMRHWFWLDLRSKTGW